MPPSFVTNIRPHSLPTYYFFSSAITSSSFDYQYNKHHSFHLLQRRPSQFFFPFVNADAAPFSPSRKYACVCVCIPVPVQLYVMMITTLWLDVAFEQLLLQNQQSTCAFSTSVILTRNAMTSTCGSAIIAKWKWCFGPGLPSARLVPACGDDQGKISLRRPKQSSSVSCFERENGARRAFGWERTPTYCTFFL